METFENKDQTNRLPQVCKISLLLQRLKEKSETLGVLALIYEGVGRCVRSDCEFLCRIKLNKCILPGLLNPDY